jgi:uncharacterized protein YndB with AHSA1/START domain
MSKSPTGRVVAVAGGRALVIERTFNAPIEDVWASITESERLERWIGRWEGEPGPGRTISFLMTAEEAAEPEDVRIVECEPPRLLRLVLDQGADGWHVALTLDESDGVTTLRFSQSVGDELDISDVGPGWEFYLDRLVAARADAPLPEWDEDYLGQAAHYAAEQAAAR